MWWTDANTQNAWRVLYSTYTFPTQPPPSQHTHTHTENVFPEGQIFHFFWSPLPLLFQHNCQPHWMCVCILSTLHSPVWSTSLPVSSVCPSQYSLVGSGWRDFNLVSTCCWWICFHGVVSNFWFPALLMYGGNIRVQWGVWLEMQFTWQRLYI